MLAQLLNATAIIIFREILEIALIVGVLMAATRGVAGRLLLIAAGLVLGALGSAALAVSTDMISDMMDGVGQEVFNAGVMFTAVALLCWTALWMRKHGRELTQHLRQVGQEVTSGDKPLYALVFIVALTTLREGAEMVLFVQGQLMIGQASMAQIVSGCVTGAVLGLLAGAALYAGLLRAAQKHLLAVTGWMLILLAAGLAAQGVQFLIQADVISHFTQNLWDSSALLEEESAVGMVLQTLVGYTARPSAVELAVYLTVLLGVGGVYYRSGSRKMAPNVAAAAVPTV